MNYREGILLGAREATRLHDSLGIRHKAESNGGRVDVFDSALALGATVMFRNLDGILGAYIKEMNNSGILVTTRRRLPIQRFTGAHEVGHLFMRHEPSIDGDEILKGPNKSLDDKEIQANGFAAEFIAPRWLIAHHAKLQGWDSESIRDEKVVYQLSLRLGLSYEATCNALASHKLIEPNIAQSLRLIQPKKIKRDLLPLEYAPEKWYGDVWLLTESDRGARIEGHPDDLFMLRLREKSASGYLWDLDSLHQEGFDILVDHGTPIERAIVGGENFREVLAGGAKQHIGLLTLSHRRHWQSRTKEADLKVNYDLAGKECGLPRAQRKKLLAA